MANNSNVKINSGYLQTNRGIIKIAQIIIALFISGLLCASWVGGRSCFGEGRIGYASGLNFVLLIINVVLLVLNLLSMSSLNLEKIYSVIATVLFAIAAALLIWRLVVAISDNVESTRMIVATVLITAQFALHLYDVRILQGQTPN